MPFALVRYTEKSRILMYDADGKLMVYSTEDNAQAYLDSSKHDNQWIPEKMTADDFRLVNDTNQGRKLTKVGKSVMEFKDNKKTYSSTTTATTTSHKEPSVMAATTPITSTKAVSPTSQVDVFEDFQNRKFAIASRADSENEFITEISSAMANPFQGDWSLRLRELLPLIVDMCCKYRGYKAESVTERRELIAGDLQMPRGK